MAMELKIITSEDEFLKEITWNHEEIKKAVEEKLADYKNLVYTEAQLPEAKKDRANLNKFIQALEAKRKEIKKRCLEPYEEFESQMKEIIALVKEPVDLIDSQIKEYEEAQKTEKREHIEALFREIGFQDFITPEKIWNDKWLNKSYSLKAIEEDMLAIRYRIGNDVLTINSLPEFSFEALEVYKDSLDLAAAISEGHRLADIQKRKEEAEAARKAAEEARKEEAKPAAGIVNPEQAVPDDASVKEVLDEAPGRSWVTFKALLTVEEAKTINNWLRKMCIEFKVL